MKFKPKRQRLLLLLVSLAVAGAAATLMITAFRDNIVFFFSPSEIAQKNLPEGARVRVGGLVEAGSVLRDGTRLTFSVTDGAARLVISYNGIAPDLFREGQGVVAEGLWNGRDAVEARKLLAKHDEKYMPPEVADALKKTGRWKEGAAP